MAQKASHRETPSGEATGSEGRAAADRVRGSTAPHGATPDGPPSDSPGPRSYDGEVPDPPQAAAKVFGPRLGAAVRFAEHLSDTGISHGLIGPREVPRLWDRHILNCAVIAEAMSPAATVIDIGSGAGLPGLAVALARPDLSVSLVEPMERRTAWLTMVTQDLGLGNVSVLRARAEELHGQLSADVVTARAVAAMDKLARWCLPLVAPGGSLIAMKGSSADQELTAATRTLRRLGAGDASIRTCGEGILQTPTTIVVVEMPSHGNPRQNPKSAHSLKRRR